MTVTRSTRSASPRRRLQVESLEDRLYLSGVPPFFLDAIPTPEIPAPAASAETATEEPGTTLPEIQRTGDFARAAEAINRFAFDLYQHFQQEEGNLFLSPMSIATALAMTYAGANGATASQMADVLHFGDEPGIHDSFQALLESIDPADDSRPFELDVANSLWPQIGYPFREAFLELVASQYRGAAQGLDYISDAEGARGVINAWVEQHTHEKIKDLIPEGALNELTRMVLTNAIYFKGQWAEEFDPALTEDRPFYLPSGETIDAPTMYLNSDFRYCERDGFQVLEMPYKGDDLSMVLLLPKAGTSLQDLSGDTLLGVNRWLDNASPKQDVIVRLPKFKTTVSSSLNKVLTGMGMPLAFDQEWADFSEMAAGAQQDKLHISQVLHKAFVEVNEEGTEAAAATAVIMMAGCFAAGTLVLTSEGARPIETLQPGDSVLSRNEHDVDADVSSKPIEEVFVRTGPTLDVKVAGQVIRTTQEHPFHVLGKGWLPAGKLKPGDRLATNEQQSFEVEEIIETGLVETVYNFRVADHHTYFVGHHAWDCGLWVHNTYFEATPPIEFTADHSFHYFIRDNETGTILFMGRMDDPLQEENSVTPEATETEQTDPGDPPPPAVSEPEPPADRTRTITRRNPSSKGPSPGFSDPPRAAVPPPTPPNQEVEQPASRPLFDPPLVTGPEVGPLPEAPGLARSDPAETNPADTDITDDPAFVGPLLDPWLVLDVAQQTPEPSASFRGPRPTPSGDESSLSHRSESPSAPEAENTDSLFRPYAPVVHRVEQSHGEDTSLASLALASIWWDLGRRRDSIAQDDEDSPSSLAARLYDPFYDFDGA